MQSNCALTKGQKASHSFEKLFTIELLVYVFCLLQSRDTPPNAPAVRELDLDLTLWQPLIVDRQFVSWLVKEPTEQVRHGVRGMSSDSRYHETFSVLCWL